jgi:hypothetical protein
MRPPRADRRPAPGPAVEVRVRRVAVAGLPPARAAAWDRTVARLVALATAGAEGAPAR